MVSQYLYKLGIATSAKLVRLSHAELELHEKKQQTLRLLRTVAVNDISTINLYRGLEADEPGGDSFAVDYCRLKIRGSRSIVLSNASALNQPNGKLIGSATNQQSAYWQFLADLVGVLISENTDCRVVVGQWGASLLGVGIAMLGIGMVALSVGIMLTEARLLDGLIPAAFSGVFSLLLIGLGVSYVQRYWPHPSCLVDLRASLQDQMSMSSVDARQ